jgi:hypothetical protein
MIDSLAVGIHDAFKKRFGEEKRVVKEKVW